MNKDWRSLEERVHADGYKTGIDVRSYGTILLGAGGILMVVNWLFPLPLISQWLIVITLFLSLLIQFAGDVLNVRSLSARALEEFIEQGPGSFGWFDWNWWVAKWLRSKRHIH